MWGSPVLQSQAGQLRERQAQSGTSRGRPPAGSVGEWLQQNVTEIAIASYIGSILFHEGYATWVGNWMIKFLG